MKNFAWRMFQACFLLLMLTSVYQCYKHEHKTPAPTWTKVSFDAHNHVQLYKAQDGPCTLYVAVPTNQPAEASPAPLKVCK